MRQHGTKTYHAAARGDCVGGQVGCELDTNGAAVAVGAHDAAPDDAVPGVLARHLVLGGALALVYVRNALAIVKRSILLGQNALDLNKGLLVLLHALSALVAQDHGLGIEPG